MGGHSWEVIRKLGEGGMGEVFLARTPEGKEVAVKTLAETQRGQIGLFEQEAKLLTKLRHPAIASVLGYLVKSQEIFGEDRGPCFWMEYVEGEDLLNAAKNVGAGVIPPSTGHTERAGGSPPLQIFNWFKQSLEALQYLHAQSILHGDLSPRNVLVDKTGQLKLLDFGLATSFLGSAKFNAGTLPYLAPERLYGKNFPGSDLFSIGTLFYEALSGSHPRAQCRSLQEMIRTEAKPLSETVPEFATHFSLQARLIDRMIQTDLKNRFGSADEVIAALEGGVAPEEHEETAEYYPARMFGGEEKLKEIAERLKTISKKSDMVFLHGGMGVGKKRFLNELRFQCALLGIPIHEVGPLSFKTILQSFRPDLTQGLQGYFFLNVEEIPLDSLSSLLSHRKLPDKGFFLVFHWNDDGLSEEKKRFFENLIRTEGNHEVALKNLSREETRALLDEALGRDTAKEVEETLFEQTLGNPLLLLECIRLLREQRIATKKHFSKDWLEGLVNLRSFEDLLFQRLDSLNKHEKELLLLIAAAGEGVVYETLSRVWETNGSQSHDQHQWPHHLKTVLESLLSRDLILLDPESHHYRLSLPSLEGVLIQKVPMKKMEEIHRRWLNALQSEKNDSSQKLHHALFLREKEFVNQGAGPVAESYRALGKRTEGLLIIHEALQMIDDPIETSQLLRLKVNLLNEMGRFQEALIVCDDIRTLAAPDEPAALKTVKYYFITGLIYQNLGKTEESAPRLKRCLEEANQNPDPSHIPFQTRAQTLLGIQAMNGGRLTDASAHFEEALKTVGPLIVLKAEILRNMAVIRSAEHRWPEGQKLLHQARQLYRQDHYIQGELSTLVQEGNLSLINHAPHTAEKAYREAETIAQSHDEEMFLAGLWNNLGVLARRRGDLEDASTLFSRALEIYRPMGKFNDLTESLTQSSMAEAALGRFQKAENLIDELEKYADRLPRVKSLAEEARAYVAELKEGMLGILDEPRPPDPLAAFWNQELALRILSRDGKDEKSIAEILKRFYEKLPLSLKVSFEERADYKKWVLKIP